MNFEMFMAVIIQRVVLQEGTDIAEEHTTCNLQ
jgi:hypothetical protein